MDNYGISDLVGRKITDVFWDEYEITFVTDRGPLTYHVEGECCSNSYFHDFIGLDKLLANGPVTEVGEIALDPIELRQDDYGDEYVRCYGYKIVTESPKWGPMTTVFSFRNASNGYYGGSLYRADLEPSPDGPRGTRLTEDVVSS